MKYLKLFEEFVFENIHYIKTDNFTLSDKDNDAYPFLFYNGKIYVGKPGTDHKDSCEIDIRKEDPSYESEDVEYIGRTWVKHKVISFHEYPPLEKMLDIISMVAKIMKIKIWNNGYLLDINYKYPNFDKYTDCVKYGDEFGEQYSGKLIPIERYRYSNSNVKKKVDVEYREIQPAK